MPREMTSGYHREEEPMQRSRGGAIRSSDEILVMRMERRGGVAQLAYVINPLRRGGVV